MQMRRRFLWSTAGVLGYTALKEILGRSRYLDLRGKTVLITGGSRGLGLLLVREFARAGARVALCARNGGGLERGRDELAWMGRQVLTFTGDVTGRENGGGKIAEGRAEIGKNDVPGNKSGAKLARAF